MARVLFAWELGANLGHAAPMAEIARGLAGEGVEICVAARDLANAGLAFAGIPVKLLQAPVWPSYRHFGAEDGQANFLDVLVATGFADPAKLGAVIDGWTALLDLLDPKVIVADHSPGLLAACQGRSVPVIAIGIAFAMPPLELGRFPPIRADRSPVISETAMLGVVSDVLRPRGVRPPDSLVGLFRTTERFVFAVPELDPYQPFRQEPLYWPPGPPPTFVEPPRQPRLFAYLGEELPYVETLVQVLCEIDLPITAYFRGEVGPLPEFLRLRGHIVHSEPPSLAAVLPSVSHVLSAGGAYTSMAALAAGRPHLVMPLHGETLLNFRLLDRLGVAMSFQPSGDPLVVRNALRAFLLNYAPSREARNWAAVIADRAQPRGGEAVRSAIARLTG